MKALSGFHGLGFLSREFGSLGVQRACVEWPRGLIGVGFRSLGVISLVV